jgi:hypothetical protein
MAFENRVLRIFGPKREKMTRIDEISVSRASQRRMLIEILLA